ncbi:TPA: hypothetical protein NGR52_004265 [Vibrio parahaemolyticus]|nr:hypothetical protein [Vibrio parahaemolyticus]
MKNHTTDNGAPRAINDLEMARIERGELIGMCFELIRHPSEEITPYFLHLNENWIRPILDSEHFQDRRLVDNAITWMLQTPMSEQKVWLYGNDFYSVGMCTLVFNDITHFDAAIISQFRRVSLNVPFKRFGLECLKKEFSGKVYTAERKVIDFMNWRTNNQTSNQTKH